jgi:hypothetical protein
MNWDEQKAIIDKAGRDFIDAINETNDPDLLCECVLDLLLCNLEVDLGSKEAIKCVRSQLKKSIADLKIAKVL